jgi:hypothetical protein
VVWWASHGQMLIRCTRHPTCHVQLDHSVAHMDGVSNESTKNYQQGNSKPMEMLLTHDTTPPPRSVHLFGTGMRW